MILRFLSDGAGSAGDEVAGTLRDITDVIQSATDKVCGSADTTSDEIHAAIDGAAEQAADQRNVSELMTERVSPARSSPPTAFPTELGAIADEIQGSICGVPDGAGQARDAIPRALGQVAARSSPLPTASDTLDASADEIDAAVGQSAEEVADAAKRAAEPALRSVTRLIDGVGDPLAGSSDGVGNAIATEHVDAVFDGRRAAAWCGAVSLGTGTAWSGVLAEQVGIGGVHSARIIPDLRS